MTKGEAKEKAPPPAKLVKALTALLKQYEVDVIKDTLKELTKKKVGRPRLPDWELFPELLMKDAVHILGISKAGRFSNKSIAKKTAARAGGQSEESTQRRIQRKFSENREYFAMVVAVGIAAETEPVRKYLAIIEKLSHVSGSKALWDDFHQGVQRTVDDYAAHGWKTSETTTYREILDRLGSSPRGAGLGVRGRIPRRTTQLRPQD